MPNNELVLHPNDYARAVASPSFSNPNGYALIEGDPKKTEEKRYFDADQQLKDTKATTAPVSASTLTVTGAGSTPAPNPNPVPNPNPAPNPNPVVPPPAATNPPAGGSAPTA